MIGKRAATRMPTFMPSCSTEMERVSARTGAKSLALGVPFYLWEGDEKCRRFVTDAKSVSDEGDFCGLFSFSDRPTALPSPDGIDTAKARLCARHERL